MKKYLALFLCLSLALGLWGCRVSEKAPTDSSDTTVVSSEPTVSQTEMTRPNESQPIHSGETQTVQVDPPVRDVSQIAVSLNPVAETETVEDGVTLFNFVYQDIRVDIPEHPEASENIEAVFQARLADARDSAENTRSWAKESYTGESGWTPYTSELSFEPTRLDETVLSFSGAFWEHSGGIHPNSLLTSANFDATTGELLHLSDVLTGDNMAEALCTMVMDALATYTAEKNLDASSYLPGYEDVVAKRFDLENNNDAWYFTDTGMTFYFSVYEIAPYAMGPIQVELTYEQLQGVLKPMYEPVQAAYDSTLSINAALGRHVQASLFDRILTVTEDKEGETVALFSGSDLHNVRIQKGQWSENDGSQFYPTGTIFAANFLTKSDLLLIETAIPDTLPRLCLTVNTSPTETRSYYITQSGKDSSILLEDDDVWQ